jgi:hypothetical protein
VPKSVRPSVLLSSTSEIHPIPPLSTSISLQKITSQPRALFSKLLEASPAPYQKQASGVTVRPSTDTNKKRSRSKPSLQFQSMEMTEKKETPFHAKTLKVRGRWYDFGVLDPSSPLAHPNKLGHEKEIRNAGKSMPQKAHMKPSTYTERE